MECPPSPGMVYEEWAVYKAVIQYAGLVMVKIFKSSCGKYQSALLFKNSGCYI